MSRVPFTPPAGCPDPGANIDILQDLPVCTVPAFTDAICAIRLPEIVLPDINVPDPCIQLGMNVAISPDFGATPQGSLSPDGDPCEGQYSLSLTIPCTTTSISIDSKTSSVQMATAAETPGISGDTFIQEEDASSCSSELSFTISLKVPCMIGYSTDLVKLTQQDFTSPTPNIKVGLAQGTDACQLAVCGTSKMDWNAGSVAAGSVLTCTVPSSSDPTIIWSPPAGGLPSTSGKSQYMALQLNSSLTPVWDWIRFSV